MATNNWFSDLSKYFNYLRMLQEDPELLQKYKDLVVGGILSADEFWANRFGKVLFCYLLVYLVILVLSFMSLFYHYI